MFDQYLKLENLDIIKALNIGVELEMKSRAFYKDKSNEVKNQSGKIILNFLATEELTHLKALQDVKKNLETNNKWMKIEEDDLRTLPIPRLFEGKQTEPKIVTSSSDKDIMSSAMDAEKKSQEFYLRMSEKIEDERGKGFFQTLAKFEKTHYEMILEIIKPGKFYYP
jgi:rubrerythrin